jgi:hypothetical protein
VAHTCDPSYPEGRDREGHGLKQTVRETLSQKTHHKNRAGGVAQDVGPEFKPQYWKKKSKERDCALMAVYYGSAYIMG